MMVLTHVPLEDEIEILLNKKLGFDSFTYGFIFMKMAVLLLLRDDRKTGAWLWSKIRREKNREVRFAYTHVFRAIESNWERNRVKFLSLNPTYEKLLHAPTCEQVLDDIVVFLHHTELLSLYEILPNGRKIDKGFETQERMVFRHRYHQIK